METIKKYDVFVSYSHADSEWVETVLLPKLESWKLNIAIDQKSFLPGCRLPSTIKDFIALSKHVIFVCTSNFINSEWCRDELETTQAEDPESLKAKAIPIVLDQKYVPPLLQDVIWCDLSRNKNDENEWKKLCHVIDGEWDFEKSKELCSFITSAISEEFSAYKSLPLLNLSKLELYYDTNSSAYVRIKNILVQHLRRGWCLSNPGNPSFAKVLDIKVESITQNECRIKTQEYWYLRWFSKQEQKYRKIYDELNKQLYILNIVDSEFRIITNIYPKPNQGIIKKCIKFINNGLRMF